MKRNIVLAGTALIALLSIPSAALELKTGLAAGINLSKFSGSDAQAIDDKTKAISNVGNLSIGSYPLHQGLAASARFSLECYNWVALLSELSFAQQGSIGKGSAGIGKIVNGVEDTLLGAVEVRQTLNSFNLPFFIAFKPHLGPFSPMVYAGPAFSFIAFAENVNKVENGKNTKSDIKYLTYNTVNHDLVLFYANACAGGGIGYTLFGYEWLLDARYSRGLTSVIKDMKINVTTIAVTLGVMIPR